MNNITLLPLTISKNESNVPKQHSVEQVCEYLATSFAHHTLCSWLALRKQHELACTLELLVIASLHALPLWRECR